jgi:phosphate/sulfate permease
MKGKTKKIFFVSILAAAMAGSFSAVFYYLIDKNAKTLEERVAVLTENNNKESNYVRMERLVGETETERRRQHCLFR